MSLDWKGTGVGGSCLGQRFVECSGQLELGKLELKRVHLGRWRGEGETLQPEGLLWSRSRPGLTSLQIISVLIYRGGFPLTDSVLAIRQRYAFSLLASLSPHKRAGRWGSAPLLYR